MRSPTRWIAGVLLAALCAGCSPANVWNEVPVREPSFTPAPEPSEETEPDDRVLHPYEGTLGADSTCQKATKAELAEWGEIGGLGVYLAGSRVRSNGPWWTAVAVTRVVRDNGQTVEKYQYFVTSWPTYGKTFEHEPFIWRITDVKNDAAAAKALACVKKLPLPKQKLAPNDPATYNGRPESGAKCRTVSASLLDRIQQVGQVGGAITYPRGQMVRANRKWWTVAVATQVNANSEGYTRDNVPATALFVTNAPSFASPSNPSIVSFPITERTSDTAARKALACLDD